MQSFRMVLWRQLDKAILNDVLETLDGGELTLTTASKELCVDRKTLWRHFHGVKRGVVGRPLFTLSFFFEDREVDLDLELGAVEDRERVEGREGLVGRWARSSHSPLRRLDLDAVSAPLPARFLLYRFFRIGK